ncbi:hypothetical protein PCANC_07089 [Puccinia coronata f. sp. avenae]|uniref:Uncharacterized protein n=1 Tax=Puccinia coronata f. sp. avenae TaxID=200324 RepID=A0A2N5VIM9_9BASI|nr:hypothetical protein PCANC_07089 [Puccinia coronata f. sp. avenae]
MSGKLEGNPYGTPLPFVFASRRIYIHKCPVWGFALTLKPPLEVACFTLALQAPISLTLPFKHVTSHSMLRLTAITPASTSKQHLNNSKE